MGIMFALGFVSGVGAMFGAFAMIFNYLENRDG